MKATSGRAALRIAACLSAALLAILPSAGCGTNGGGDPDAAADILAPDTPDISEVAVIDAPDAVASDGVDALADAVTGDMADAVAIDLPGESAGDAPTEAAGDVPCGDGERACDGTITSVCIDGLFRPVADCAADDWTCAAGRCVATGAEDDVQAAYRERVDALRLANLRTPLELDAYGGWKNAPAALGAPQPGGFFRVAKLDGAWWFLTPEGHPFLSKGVTDVAFLISPNDETIQAALAAKYDSEEAWLAATQARLDDWGFNTIGPWSSPSIAALRPATEIILDIGGHHVPRPHGSVVADLMVPEYPDIVRQVAAAQCAARKDDPSFLGYFLDNELVWGNSWQTDKSLLQLYWEFPAQQPGRIAAEAFLRERAGESLATFNATWGTSLAAWDELPALASAALKPVTAEATLWTEAFAVMVFGRYAGEAVKAIREVDPNHLVLGCRFSTWHFDALMVEAAKHFDVVSLAYYSPTPPLEALDRAAPAIDRPFLLEEWSFKAEDSGLMNILNYAPVVSTQKDRALAYSDYVGSLMRRPWMVAFHWYKWFDNPAREDNILAGDNFGLMNAADEPYVPFVRMVREVNRQVEAMHREGIPPDVP